MQYLYPMTCKKTLKAAFFTLGLVGCEVSGKSSISTQFRARRASFTKQKRRIRPFLVLSVAVSSSAALSACFDLTVDRQPFPIQDQVCDFFDKTDHMREYWIGISESAGYPDIKVRIPSEYMDFRLQKFEKAAHLDGAIGFGVRPLDFAPSQNYSSVKDYPSGPIDPIRPKYKTANGWILLKQPRSIPENARITIASNVGDKTPFLDIIMSGVVSDEHPDLLKVENNGVQKNLNEVLLYAPDNEIKAYFKCGKRELEESGRLYHSSCTMRVNHLPVSIQLRFDRDFLPEWPELLSRAEKFVDCMILDIKTD